VFPFSRIADADGLMFSFLWFQLKRLFSRRGVFSFLTSVRHGNRTRTAPYRVLSCLSGYPKMRVSGLSGICPAFVRFFVRFLSGWVFGPNRRLKTLFGFYGAT
jgi:hypothetical protein